MSRTRSLLRHGLWPDAPASTKEPTHLTAAARSQGLTAIEELDRLGVVVKIEDGKARFRGRATTLDPAARRIVEKLGDVIEAVLIERARTMEEF